MRLTMALSCAALFSFLIACGGDGTSIPSGETPSDAAAATGASASPTAMPSEVPGLSFELIDVWGDDPSEPQFEGPNHMDIGPEGNLYLTEFRGGRLWKLSLEGEVLAQWAGAGTEPGQLGGPTGIDVDGAGFIYVAESQNHRVQKFSPEGDLVASWGSRGSEPGQFQSAMGVLAEPSRVLVVDFGNGRVQEFTPEGDYVSSISEEGVEAGQLRQPIGIAPTLDGGFYVVDTGNYRVQQFAADGAVLGEIDIGERIGFDSPPQVISIDPEGFFYLSVPGLAVVVAFDEDGERLARVPLGLNQPHDTAVSPDGSRLFLADTGNSVIKVYEILRP